MQLLFLSKFHKIPSHRINILSNERYVEREAHFWIEKFYESNFDRN